MLKTSVRSCQLVRHLNVSDNHPIEKMVCHNYENMLMHNGCKNDNFQLKNCGIFLIFALNIDCGYTLEPSR